MLANIIWTIAIAVVFFLSSFLWIKIGRLHLLISICFLPVFSLLGYLKNDILLPFGIASVGMILVWVFKNINGITGILLGLESAAAAVTAVSLLPFFPNEIYESFMTWLLGGGEIVFVILFWPIAIFLFVIAKANNDML